MTTPLVTGLTERVDQVSEKAQTQERKHTSAHSTSALDIDGNNRAEGTRTCTCAGEKLSKKPLSANNSGYRVFISLGPRPSPLRVFNCAWAENIEFSSPHN